MNAENFFKEHSLEEISKKTKISPISLRLIRNKEFEKIPKVKLLGFIKIIEKTYNVDLSDLIEEYNTQPLQKAINKNTQTPNLNKQNNNSTFFITLLALILIILGGFLLFRNLNSSTKNNVIPKENIKPEIIKKDIKPQKSPVIPPIKIKSINNSINSTNTSLNKTVILPKENNITKKYKITIIPNKLLWFKIINIDTNKSRNFLTTHKKIFPKGNYYIKFGHGDFNLTYNNQTISPKTKKVIRILFENGKYKFMKKPNRFEK